MEIQKVKRRKTRKYNKRVSLGNEIALSAYRQGVQLDFPCFATRQASPSIRNLRLSCFGALSHSILPVEACQADVTSLGTRERCHRPFLLPSRQAMHNPTTRSDTSFLFALVVSVHGGQSACVQLGIKADYHIEACKSLYITIDDRETREDSAELQFCGEGHVCNNSHLYPTIPLFVRVVLEYR